MSTLTAIVGTVVLLFVALIFETCEFFLGWLFR